MSTFSKLSLVAQYDDMCRLVNKLVKESAEEEEVCIAMLEKLQKRWYAREKAHEKVKEDLKMNIKTLEREIKKNNRHLAESRAALVREAEEKKAIARERKALLDQIRQVRQLVESKDGLGNNDAHRKRVIKCLDVDRLSPIQSDDDSDDGASGLDYDRTEEDILDTDYVRKSNAFEGAMPSNEQETLLYRYLDKGSENQHNAENENDNDTDSTDIEFVRQQLQRFESEKRKLASAPSTPNVKSATLAAKSTTSLLKSISNTPVPNTQKPHSFVRKKSFKPDSCGPCGGKISFYGNVEKCENCGVISHPECKEKCPLPCVKITAPTTRSSSKKILISDYVNNDAVPKVPALIVHCCNEIERGDNINTEGLYSVSARIGEIEDLQQKILKSKSGMPNLSSVDVHLLTGVVKKFLQTLDESLITTTLWTNFVSAIESGSEIEAQTSTKVYIGYLPTANRETLAFFMQHLHAIAENSDKNRMTTKNLVRALAPTVIGNSCCNPSQSTIQQEKGIQTKIMEVLFAIEKDFWSQYVEKSTARSTSLGSRLLGTPSSSAGPKTRSSRLGGTLPTPKVKPLFS